MNSQPSEWKKIIAAEGFAQISTTGKKVKTKDCAPIGKYPVVDQGQEMIGGYVDDSEKLISLNEPLIVFGDHTRAVKWVDFSFVPGADGTKILQAEPYLLPRFAYQQLRSRSIPCKGYSRHFKFLKQLESSVPPLPEQKVIADKLDTLLAQVENTKARLERIPQILKRFRQSVLAAAVSGRLTEEWRERNPNKTTEALLEEHDPLPKPARWKSRSDAFIQGNYATAVGKPEANPVPQWKWISLVEVARMESGHTPSRNKPEYWNGDICWIGIRDANKNHGKTIQDTEQKTNAFGLANSASRLLPTGTVCISRTASVGYVVKMGKDMATSQDFVNWVPSPVIDPDWLKWLFVAERDSLLKFGKGSTHTTVYFPEWLSMHILLPHIEEQREIVRRVDQLFAHADRIEQQVNNALTRVNNLTQSILAKAFRGELTAQWRRDNPELISGENSAEALLERIKAERATVKPAKKTRKRKTTV